MSDVMNYSPDGEVKTGTQAVSISLAEKALLASIKRAGVPLTMDQIYLNWRPTWSMPEIKLLLDELVRAGLIRVFDKTGSGNLYFAAWN
jgi:hypothetical protein